ncbi:AfsR/SARP family transcriptional regulator [Streptomyces virginiae]|uniref:AfsR/SARP family transcriptional regulator n=1 Tax=Streptomyces virginiae TaxID=1961 RepID=UPI002DBDD735|nr:BTAD domain-containing putative transcriptional regulator [Streptomyces sp. CMAA1738]MEC4570278.1 BTAD domain-containing putative transcriptional regulator [Streptomyces sp. CMAA1738]
MKFFVLGSVGVSHGGPVLTGGPPQQQATLAVLVLRAGHVVPLHELTAAVWGESAPGSAVMILRTYVWRLRKLLEGGGAGKTGAQILESANDGYRLAVPPGSVDAVRAEELAAKATRAHAAGEPEVCAEALAEAGSLWRGEPLAGVPGPFAESQRSRLTELRLHLLEERLGVDLLLGRHERAVPELSALIREEPLRERPYGLLMRALYAAGRQGDALAVFGRAREVLADELGLDPGPDLRSLHARILSGDPALLPAAASPAPRREGEPPARLPATPSGAAPREPAGAHGLAPGGAPASGGAPAGPRAAVAATGVPRAAEALGAPRVGDPGADRAGMRDGARAAVSGAHAAPDPAHVHGQAQGPAAAGYVRPAQLPADIADFSGRAAQLDALTGVLSDPARTALAVAAVSGMGGIGKSALALRVAHLVKDAYPDGHLYADLRGTGSDPADPGTVLTSLLGALGVPRREVPTSTEDRARLFRTVLDGRRLLLLLDDARDIAQVKPLLPGAAGCAVVVTSRARLGGLLSGRHVQLEEFTPAEALGLLRHIVGADRVDREEEAAAALVEACARLPLAVRIVAARLAARPGWTVAHLVARLADERRRLTELRADDLAVAAVFELGHRQLTGPQASVFRRLAPVSRPGIGLAAAAAALDLAEPEAEELLEALVDAALLESPEPGRYRHHELGRDFALNLPAPAGEPGPPVQHRLLHHLLGMAAEAFQWMIPGDPVHRSIVAAAAGPGRGRLADLAEARAWVVGEFDCALHAVQLVVRRPDTADTEQLTMAADLLVALSSFGQDIPYARITATAAELARAATLRGNDRAAGRAHFLTGNAALQATDLGRARAAAELAVRACRRAGDRAILQQAYNDLGVIAQFEHRFGEAAECFDEALVLAREQGHRSGALTITLNAALARVRGGRAAEALPACEEALEALREMADHHGVAHALCVRGQALHELGRLEEALAAYEECLDLCDAVRIPGQRAQAEYRCARTLSDLRRTREALEASARAVAHLRTVPGRGRDRGYALLIHAGVCLAAGRREEGLRHAGEALEVFERAGLPEAEEARTLLEAAVAVRLGC